MRPSFKFLLLLSVALNAQSVRAAPSISATATIQPTVEPIQTVTQTTTPVSSVYLNDFGSLHNTTASAVAGIDYSGNALATAASLGYANGISAWSETFSNTTSATLSFSFTYKLAGSMQGDFSAPAGYGDMDALVTSTLGFTPGGGARTDHVITRGLRIVKSSGGFDPVVVTTSGSGVALTGENLVTTSTTGVFSLGSTYITVELGDITPGETFTLDYNLSAIVNNKLPFCAHDCAIGSTPFYVASGEPKLGLFSRPAGTSIPEPGSLMLVAIGLAGLSVARRRRPTEWRPHRD